MAGVVNMKDVIKILDKIEEMTTIGELTIKTEGIEITVVKTAQPIQPIQPVSMATLPSFTRVSDGSPSVARTNTVPGQASEFQVKYARDLMAKVFGEDEKGGLDFLAHTLEVLKTDVPDITEWESLSQDMVGNIIDALSPMHKSKRSEF